MKRWLAGLLCVALSGTALATGPDAVRKRVQASMLVTGTIEVAPDGSVAQYALDHPEALPQAVQSLLAKAIPSWRFAPVQSDGKPVLARASMGIRVVASPLGNDSYRVGVGGVWFGNGDGSGQASAATITYKSRVRPRYPEDAAYAKVSGTVYVLLKVGRDGKVADAAAEQVDLRIIASDSQMAVWRGVLADAALRALRHDTFNPPTVGHEAGRPYWVARVPVTFDLQGPAAPLVSRRVAYGQWQPYVPGPVQEPVWSEAYHLAGSADALPTDGVSLADTGLRLLTPLRGT